MSDWNDLFVRTSLEETTPDNRAGGLSSPDVIPVGIVPTDPAKFTSEESYRTFASNEPFQQGQPNYIYVRAKNSAANTPAVGEAYLAMANPAVVIWPGGDGWTRIKTNNQKDASPLQPSPTGGGAIAITTDAFVCVPTETGHRCLVTWLSTKSHPTKGPPPRIDNMNDLVKFLKDNPNYAHHNIDIAASTTGAVTNKKPFSSGTAPALWRLGLQATGCKGFNVSFSSSDKVPGGDFIALGSTTVAQNETIAYLTGAIEIPANWNTYMNYTYETNNLQPEDFEVTFVSYVDVGQDHEFWDFAKPYEHFGVPAELAPQGRRGIALGSIGLMKGKGSVK